MRLYPHHLGGDNTNLRFMLDGVDRSSDLIQSLDPKSGRMWFYDRPVRVDPANPKAGIVIRVETGKVELVRKDTGQTWRCPLALILWRGLSWRIAEAWKWHVRLPIKVRWWAFCRRRQSRALAKTSEGAA